MKRDVENSLHFDKREHSEHHPKQRTKVTVYSLNY